MTGLAILYGPVLIDEDQTKSAGDTLKSCTFGSGNICSGKKRKIVSTKQAGGLPNST